MKQLYVVLFFVFLIACNKENDKGFLIEGVVENITDSTKIFLQYKNNTSDSTFVINEKFEFKGKTLEPQPVYLLLKETNDFKSIWLENSFIEIKGDKGNFKNALTTGSLITTQADSLEKSFRKYLQRKDSTYKLSISQNISDSSRNVATTALKTNFKDRRKIDKDFIRLNPNSFISAYKLDFYSSTFGKSFTEKLYQNFSDELKKSSYGKSINEFLTLNKRMALGDKYADFSALNINNSIINISNYTGKVIFLEFWNTHCIPCIKEFPHLKKAYNNFKDRDFEIISISDDRSVERWKNMVQKKELSWTNLIVNDSLKSVSHKIYGITGYPTNFLIDKNGNIIAKDLRGESLIKKLTEIIN